MSALPEHMCVHCMHARCLRMSEEDTGIPWNWCYTWSSATLWVLGIKFESSAGVASTLKF